MEVGARSRVAEGEVKPQYSFTLCEIPQIGIRSQVSTVTGCQSLWKGCDLGPAEAIPIAGGVTFSYPKGDLGRACQHPPHQPNKICKVTDYY